jgi:WD repeat-containing protein 61
MASQKVSAKLEAAHNVGIWSLAFCGESRLLTGDLDGTLKYWSPNLGLIGGTRAQRHGITSVVASSSTATATAAACFQDSTIRFYHLHDNGIEEAKVYDEEKQAEVADVLVCGECGNMEAWSISLANDGLTLATGSNSGVVGLYSIESEGGGKREKIATLESDQSSKLILSTNFSPSIENQHLVCSSVDGSVMIFDVLNQQLLTKLNHHSLPTRCVKFSPDGNLIYSASDDRHVCVYDTISGTIVNSFSHAGMTFCVDAARDHRHFVVGSADNVVSLWDLGMQRCETTYNSHTDQVWGVGYDPKDDSGRRFVSVGDDSLIQIYE